MTLHFKSCKISSRIPLEKLVSFFNMKRSNIWKEYVVLNEPQIMLILKQYEGFRSVFLFEFGCIAFVNFLEFEVQLMIDFLSGMMEKIDYSMMAKFAEAHTLEIDADRTFLPWKKCRMTFQYEDSVMTILSTVLAKSVALDKIEEDVSRKIDESEKYIDFLKHGRLRLNKKSLTGFISGFLKFEHESISHIRIYDRSIANQENMNCRELYDQLAEYYELHDRFDVLQCKINSFRNTFKTYNSLSYQRSEDRLYLFEIFLLLLFPLVSVLRMVMHF